MINNSPKVSNFNRLFFKLNQFICNQPPILPGHRSTLTDGNEQSSPIHYCPQPVCVGGLLMNGRTDR